MPLTVQSRFHPIHADVAVVTLAGDVDISTAARLRDDLAALLGEGARHLVLDFGGVAFMDSSGLSVLAGISPLLRGAGMLALVSVNPRIRDVLRTTGLTRLFPIYSSVETAVLVLCDESRPS
ncbi:STAS domain-containing protein [Actinomadura sp. WMMB 499]|uniref:STAS domain-containing protein n=1 Tax=Actinomadura sp. WMMB 499 TaxID=1219491 RepID=UPI001243EDED|nr:STAS domain-containing protein [Actinomadura sp. WMMB 499]QFG20595.1 STAS domain-containing protein [Actinomadura sp. WMMB 499]